VTGKVKVQPQDWKLIIDTMVENRQAILQIDKENGKEVECTYLLIMHKHLLNEDGR
jgi:hypothetical protein